jgi:hypothetical protein
LGSEDDIGNNGGFAFKKDGHQVYCQASDGLGWEHVSVSIKGKKMPSWNLMCYVKNLFWDEDDTVFQYHPPKKAYVSFKWNCLHLWKPTGEEIPVPDPILVGPK